MKLLLLLLSIIVILAFPAKAQFIVTDGPDVTDATDATDVTDITTILPSTTVPSSIAPREYPCPASGYLRDPEDCAAFFRCDPSHGTYATALLRCPANLLFDKTLNVCNWPSAVDCDDEPLATN